MVIDKDEALKNLNFYNLKDAQTIYTWDDFIYMYKKESQVNEYPVSALIATYLIMPKLLSIKNELNKNTGLPMLNDEQDFEDFLTEIYISFTTAIKNLNFDKFDKEVNIGMTIKYLSPYIKEALTSINLNGHSDYQIKHGLWKKEVFLGEGIALDKQYNKRDTVNSETYKNPVDVMGFSVQPSEQIVFSLVEQKRKIVRNTFIESYVPLRSEGYAVRTATKEREYLTRLALSKKEFLLTFIKDLEHWSEDKLDEALDFLHINKDNIQEYSGYDKNTFLNGTKQSPGLNERIVATDTIFDTKKYMELHNISGLMKRKYFPLQVPTRSVVEDNMLSDIISDGKLPQIKQGIEFCKDHNYPPAMIFSYCEKHKIDLSKDATKLLFEESDHYGNYEMFFTDTIKENIAETNKKIAKLLTNQYFKDTKLKYIHIKEGDSSMQEQEKELSKQEQLAAIKQEKSELLSTINDVNSTLKTLQKNIDQINLRLKMLDKMEKKLESEISKEQNIESQKEETSYELEN